MAASPYDKVERIIGHKRGTKGVGYLRRVLDVRFFPKLCEIRTQL